MNELPEFIYLFYITGPLENKDFYDWLYHDKISISPDGTICSEKLDDTDDEQEITTRSDDEIRQIRNDLLNAIEQEMINTEADESDIYESLEELYIDTYQTLTNEILQDSELVDVKLPTTTPLLVLAYDKYESAKRVDEIARRNNVVNPCFASDSLILQRN